jgi:hypothetical protein
MRRCALTGVLVGAVVTGSCSDAVIPLITTWEGSLEALKPGGPRGSLAVISQPGRAQTSLQLIQGRANATYSWRIKSGSCAAPGDIVGGVASYPQLTAGDDGAVSGQTTLSRELSPDGSFAGWIYEASAVGEPPVACGDLRRSR